MDRSTALRFQISYTTVTEVGSECTFANNEKVQERERMTTAPMQGLVSSVARERNPITGCSLTGYSAATTSS